jgi:hypothetical protein
MFKVLLKYLNRSQEIKRDLIAQNALSGDADAQHMLRFMDGLGRFAFFEELSEAVALSEKGLNPWSNRLRKAVFKEIHSPAC